MAQRTVNYACKNDDEQFTQAPDNAHARRIDWIHKVMEGRWNGEGEEPFLDILEGKEEDVWLWVDGDEEALPKLEPWSTTGLPYTLAAKALQTGRASKHFESLEMAEMRQRVQLENPAVRLAAIAWLVYTSKTMKRLDGEYGRMDSEEWALSGLIWDWWWSLEDVWDQLPEALPEEFERTLEKEGHTCYTELWYWDEQMIGQWLYVQSVLFPERSGVPVNLMRREVGKCKMKCKACRN